MASVTTRATGYAAVSPALKLRRQVLNVRAAKYFAVAIAAVMGLFIVFHWTRFLYHRYGLKEKRGVTIIVVGWQRLTILIFDHTYMLTQPGRGVRRFLFRRFAGYRLDRTIVVVTYLAINMVLLFSPSLIQYHFKPLVSSFGKRLGCTFALLVQVISTTLALR